MNRDTVKVEISAIRELANELMEMSDECLKSARCSGCGKIHEDDPNSVAYAFTGETLKEIAISWKERAMTMQNNLYVLD